MAERPQRIVLIGFSGAGKSTVATALASRLGWVAIDTDALVQEAAGGSIPEIFARDGEAAFRKLEHLAVLRAARTVNAVIATGGGVFMDPDSRRVLADAGFVVALEARVDTIAARTRAAEDEARPLLAGGDALARIRDLKAARQPFYALADCTIHTDVAGSGAVADQILRVFEQEGPALLESPSRLQAIVDGPGLSGTAPPDFGADTACTVRASGGFYPVYVGWGLLERIADKLATVGADGRLFVVTDTAVQPLYGELVITALRKAGRDAAIFAVPPGEQSKSLESLASIYDWLAAQRAERVDTVLALGGGVVTDLAGAAAATYLRGLNLVHAPTTLLGMVDAAIGGKVAIDLPAGKNLVGAFYQPRAVVADVAMLSSLPPRELRAGFAEVIKHAFIRDPALLDDLERDADALLAPPRDEQGRGRLAALIARNVAIKAAVVSADEREADLRMILNYGHTIAHALEAATGYTAIHHGEAVGVGLVGAAMIAARLGLLDSAIIERHRRVVERFGLPTSLSGLSGVTPDSVLQAIQSDKKIRDGQVQWVLLEGVGRPVIRADVSDAIVRGVLQELIGG